MAESDRNSSREPAAAHSMPTPQLDEPLAGLARLIDQAVNGLASDPRRSKPAETARELDLAAQDGYAASDVLQKANEAQSFTAGPINHEFEFDRLGGSSDDGRYETSSHADGLTQSRSASYEDEPQWYPDAEDLHVESSHDGNDEHEDQSHDTTDGHTYTDEEDSNWPRRPKIIVAVVLGLALLGTGGAFGYRALFANSTVPSPPTIIKAEGGPNKIIPASRDSQGTLSPQSYADNAVSNERLEAPPLDAPPPVTTAPQPGAASVLSPVAQPAPAAHGDSFNSPPVAPSPPIPSADQAAAPDAVTATPVSPAKPEPEKTPTVSIRTDQPNRADSAAIQPQRPTAEQQVTRPSDANGPLSSGGDYAVQVLSQHNEEEVQSSFSALQTKYPKLLGGREPMVRRADLGAKGVYYRAMVGPFVSAKQANELCSRLKAAGGSCIIQKN